MDNLEPVTTGQWLDPATPATRSTCALRVTGDSMEPRFPHGTIVIVAPDAKPKNGNFVIARLNEEALLRQLAIENGVACLKPLNPSYPAMWLDAGVVVCGVITRVIFDVE